MILVSIVVAFLIMLAMAHALDRLVGGELSKALIRKDIEAFMALIVMYILALLPVVNVCIVVALYLAPFWEGVAEFVGTLIGGDKEED